MMIKILLLYFPKANRLVYPDGHPPGHAGDPSFGPWSAVRRWSVRQTSSYMCSIVSVKRFPYPFIP